MSGVGITGKIKPKDGGIFPVFEDTDGQGGYRSVANIAARDAIPANFRSVMMEVALQDTGLTYQLVGGITNAYWRLGGGASQPFVGDYFVDPNFTGIQTGSASNPFTTVAAVFAHAVAIGVANGVVSINSPIVEDIVFPTTGEWNLIGLTSPGNLSAITITGNVALSASALARRWLQNVRITGNVTGNTDAGVQRITFERVTVEGTTTLTVSGSGAVRLGTLGGVPGSSTLIANMGYSAFVGAVAVQGTAWLYTAALGSTLSVSGICTFCSCSFNGAITTTDEVDGDNQLIFNNCYAPVSITVSQINSQHIALIGGSDTVFDTAALNFTGVGINVLGFDAVTARSMFQHGATVTGNVTPVTMAAARRTANTDNIGLIVFAEHNPIPQLRVNGTLTLVTPGTLGSAVLNITYTDSLGVERTKAVTPALNIAGAAGDEAQGALLFTQDGSASFQFSVTGITTPGALSYNLAISIEPGM